MVLSLYLCHTRLCWKFQLAWYRIFGRKMSRNWWHLCESYRKARWLVFYLQIVFAALSTYIHTHIYAWFVYFLAQRTIIRDCLSALSFRTDIPADKYEGCRPAAKDVHLANYVNHTIKEHDVKRDYFSDVQFCFCFLDHRCNGADKLLKTNVIFGFSALSIMTICLKYVLYRA